MEAVSDKLEEAASSGQISHKEEVLRNEDRNGSWNMKRLTTLRQSPCISQTLEFGVTLLRSSLARVSNISHSGPTFASRSESWNPNHLSGSHSLSVIICRLWRAIHRLQARSKCSL